MRPGCAAERLHPAVLACARWCTLTGAGRRGHELPGLRLQDPPCRGRSAASRQMTQGGLSHGRACCVSSNSNLSFTQSGTSWHATLRVNGLCVAVFTGATRLSSAGRLLGVWLSPRVQRRRGSSGVPGQGVVPRHVLHAQGPRPEAAWGLLVGG